MEIFIYEQCNCINKDNELWIFGKRSNGDPIELWPTLDLKSKFNPNSKNLYESYRLNKRFDTIYIQQNLGI